MEKRHFVRQRVSHSRRGRELMNTELTPIQTLVMLEEKNHEDFRYGKIPDYKLQEVYQSWKKIRSSFDKTLEAEN